MKTRAMLFLCCICMLVLSGCWDDIQLRDTTFVYGVGVDRSEKSNIVGTYVVQKVRNANQGGGEKISDVISADGDSIFEVSRSADMKVTGMMQFRTIRVLVIGKELARQDLFSFLEPILRSRGTPPTMKVVMAEGKASELLYKNKVGLQQTVDYLIDEVKNGEIYTHISKNNLQDVMTLMLDDGRDFGLPMFKIEGDRMSLMSLALFHGERFTGETISIPDATLLCLLAGEKGDYALLSYKRENHVISVFVRQLSQHMKIIEQKGRLTVRIPLKLKTTLGEGVRHLTDKEKRALEQNLAEDFTARAETLLAKIQKAGCDFLGVGRELNAYHHKRWVSMDWEKEYPRIHFEPQIEVEIINTGVFN